jgi:tetratricopeptide (TPR) repeat protein
MQNNGLPSQKKSVQSGRRNSAARYLLAAVLMLLILAISWFMLRPAQTDLRKLADGYALDHFLRIRMNVSEDSLRLAISKYHDGHYATSLRLCEGVLKREPASTDARQIAGIVYLHLLDYTPAIEHFHELGKQHSLPSNPGKFYEAIALLKRDASGDREKAKLLLEEVIDQNLEGKNEAVIWLD